MSCAGRTGKYAGADSNRFAKRPPHTFKDHPFHVLDDEKMEETIESIRQYSVLVPGIVRPRADGGYEIIAGHRRKHGSELAGKEEM
jgi:ParB family chromosome partitioning protein